MMRGDDIAVHIELENAGHHDDRLRVVSILKHCELESFCSIDETLASPQEGFGFLRTRRFHAPLFGASHHDERTKSNTREMNGSRVRPAVVPV